MGRGTARVALLLLGLACALLPRAVFRGEALYDRDIHLEWFSQIEGFVRAVAAGAWPLWDTTIGFGQSLLADPGAQIAYPPTWLNLLVPPWRYYTLFAVFHLAFAGVGLFLLARGLGLRDGPALAGASVWMAGGPLVSLVNVWHHFAGASFMPWVLLAAHRSFRSRRPRLAIWWGLAQAGQILAGSADMVAMTATVTAVLLAFELHGRKPTHPRNRSLAIRGLVATAAATGTTAFLWWPTLEAARGSVRASLPAEMRTAWSIHPLSLVQAVLPLPLEDVPLAPRLSAMLFDAGRPPFLASLYLGAGAVVLALAALGSARRRLRRTLLVVLLGSVLVALGRHAPVYGFLVELLPLKMFRYPSKVMIVAALAWALLVALGVEAWLGTGRRRAARASLAGAVVLGMMAAGAALATCAADGRGWSQAILGPAASQAQALRPFASALAVPALVCALAALAAGAALRGWEPTRLVAFLGALCVLDLLVVHRTLNPTVPHELVAFRPPVVDLLRDPSRGRAYVYDYFLIPDGAHRYLGRDEPYPILPPRGVPLRRAQVLSLRLYPFPPSAARWGVDGSFDVDTRGLYPRPVQRLVERFLAAEGTPARLRLLRLGAVHRVVALHTRGLEQLEPVETLPSLFPEPVRVFRVPGALPRAYAVSGWRTADDTAAEDALLDASFDPAREIVLPSGSSRAPRDDFRGEVRIAAFRADRVLLDAELSHDGRVVLVDAFDRGWLARVDGEAQALERANVAFRAVAVPAGRHRIELRYRPASARLGLMVAGLTAVVAALLWRGGARPRRLGSAPAARPAPESERNQG